MALRRYAPFGASLIAALSMTAGSALAANGYVDRVGDVKGGAGPDIASVHVSNTASKVTFRIRFAKAPPLRVGTVKPWVDMLLVGIDVPPLGPRPSAPGGEWPGANFALGTHGPSHTGMMVKLGADVPEQSRQVTRFKIGQSGSTLTFSIPRRVLGGPTWFTFTVAAARETEDAAVRGGNDFAPNSGTFHYRLGI
jgi:hypothetical protein